MSKFKKLFYLSLIFSLLVCSKKSEDNKPQFTSFEDSTLVAMINNEPIYYQDVDDAAKQIIIQTGLSNRVSYKDSVIQKKVLDGLIANTLLRQEAKKYTIEVKEQEVVDAIAKIKKNFPSEEKFIEALQKENLTMRKFKDNIVLEIKVQKLLEQQIIFQTSEISTEEAKKYYQENSSTFQEPEKVRARHILIRVKGDATEAEVEKARKKAKSILAKIKQGQDFAVLARTYSDDPAAQKGGDLGYFEQGDMDKKVKAFEDAAFSLKPGEISDLVRTELGFHIIKVEDVKKSQKIPFDKVENNIKNYLKQMKSQEQYDKYIDKLKQESKILLRENV